MLTLIQMLLRLLAAMAVGALMGWEREIQGKEAGIRTSMLVASGAAIFAIIGISLPYLIADSPANLPEIIARNSGFLGVVANIVVGIGFIGAGIIFKDKDRVHGLTTAAAVWVTAALGTLCGLGLLAFGVSSALIFTIVLYLLRGFTITPKNSGKKV